jgi:hypothetical protein
MPKNFYTSCIRKDLISKLNAENIKSVVEIKVVTLFYNTEWIKTSNNPQIAELSLLFESLTSKKSLLTYKTRSSEGNRIIEYAGSFKSTLRHKDIYNFFNLLCIFTRWYWPTLIKLPSLATWVNSKCNNCIFELSDINFLFYIAEPLSSTACTVGVQIEWTDNDFNHLLILWSALGLKPVLKYKGHYSTKKK